MIRPVTLLKQRNASDGKVYLPRDHNYFDARPRFGFLTCQSSGQTGPAKL
ncbi:hypothetical protein AIOL_004668 [Candidatus Rhodobacter oscarellae]|uniref:Uncharacterized protein n=1 Tax=Candidatus Rhodobacter oscarellae TaxID=1675527 RepID=A0A0J9EAP6_9RHOB|nr:hypothetical protein [Candidatus Rhodobacter lobularis]KMW59686.1 hypothetical protein AIOL_004668 [Candidatus Rhodobacter lobularis]